MGTAAGHFGNRHYRLIVYFGDRRLKTVQTGVKKGHHIKDTKNMHATTKPTIRWIRKGVLLFMVSVVGVSVLGATAPRFAPEWFNKGQEDLPVIVAHEYDPYRSMSAQEGGLHARLVKAVFGQAGIDVVVDIQPAKSLANYALQYGDAVAVIGEKGDFRGLSHDQLVFVPFHVTGDRGDIAYAAFNKRHEQTVPLAAEFTRALMQMIHDGTYGLLINSFGTDPLTARQMETLETALKRIAAEMGQ